MILYGNSLPVRKPTHNITPCQISSSLIASDPTHVFWNLLISKSASNDVDIGNEYHPVLKK